MIKLNPELTMEEVKDLHKSIALNDGYCPCRLDKTKESKCICEDFLQQKDGECLCGLYIKTIDFS